mmetsp:Transcript_27086/g.43371  ORF Transcript_27086/g.43371 Transcript_27086/m.43371 type:complete len:205 (-) Transcript_27086:46-660(-)
MQVTGRVACGERRRESAVAPQLRHAGNGHPGGAAQQVCANRHAHRGIRYQRRHRQTSRAVQRVPLAVASFKKKKHLCTGTVWHSVFKIMQSLKFREQVKECLYVAVTSRAVQRIPNNGLYIAVTFLKNNRRLFTGTVWHSVFKFTQSLRFRPSGGSPRFLYTHEQARLLNPASLAFHPIGCRFDKITRAVRSSKNLFPKRIPRP